MAITIICPGCKKRWTVNDKFAGQKGPCPSCKTVIEIPKKGDEVVVHAPDEGPKDSRGRAVLKPILREETEFSATTAVAIGLAIVVVLGIAVFLRTVKPLPLYLLALGAIGLAPPLVLGGYTFLRNSELEPYRGRELAIRVAACAAAYALLWGVYFWVQWVLKIDFELFQLVYVGPPFVLVGAFAAFASLDLDYTSGLIHYSLYLIVTILLRVVAGLPAF